MPRLSNPKHELFARYLANGLNQADAYEKAGYTRSTPNSSILAGREDVQQRLAELIDDKVSANEEKHETRRRKVKAGATLAEVGLTREWVLTEMMNVYDVALSDGQVKEATAALRLLGHELGMFGGDPPKADPNAEKKAAEQQSESVGKMIDFFATPAPDPAPASDGTPKTTRPASDLSIDSMLGAFKDIATD
jgi:hypothetical protein